MSPLPTVAVIGGGFAGLNAAKGLAKAPCQVVLLDRRNHHLFQPLLYQVATAVLNPADIARPIRSILRGQRNATVLLAEVRAIDRSARKLELDDGTKLDYDYLVLAAGVSHSYFGKDEWAPFAPGLKSIEDALEIRRRVLLAYEAAEREESEEKRRSLLTFVVVGGGPTGVELAGALSEIARHALRRDFRRIHPEEARVMLLEGLPRILPTFDEELAAKAESQLRSLEVEVMVGTRVTAIDATGVSLGAVKIAARTVLWAAGVQASPLARSLQVPLDRAGRVLVEKDLRVPGDERVFVAGDLASLEQDGKPLPGLAPAAIQAGRHAASSIISLLHGEKPRPFVYRDKGTLATIGRRRAIASVLGMKLSGAIAWWAWLFIHILFLIGFRSRVLVLFEWAWAYVTYERGARLITGERRQP
jgi:NADH:ubiquinone reductase (H+-translocating)